MTDWQQPLMVLFTQAEGMSVLHETVFENRLVYVPALQKMGCEIEVFSACLGGPACRFHDGNSAPSAVIRGVSKLQGAEVTLPDVRAGFSAVLAASVADNPSTLHGVHHIERGYHRPYEQFASLGLRLTRDETRGRHRGLERNPGSVRKFKIFYPERTWLDPAVDSRPGRCRGRRRNDDPSGVTCFTPSPKAPTSGGTGGLLLSRAPGRLVEFGHVLVPVAALDRERRVVRLPPLGNPLVGFAAVPGQATSAGLSPLALNVRNLRHSNSSYSKIVCLARTSCDLLAHAAPPGACPPRSRCRVPASGPPAGPHVLPCGGFQAVRRDRQRPCSTTTVRRQLSATTTTSTCRENILCSFPHTQCRAVPLLLQRMSARPQEPTMR